MKKDSPKIGVSIIIVLLVGVFFCPVFLSGCEKKLFEKPPAKVRIGENTWVVELAMTQESRHTGLSGRRELPDGRGMLFIYPESITLNFCMRGCFIPIDIVFIGSDLRVINMYAMQVEADRRGLASYSSGIPAQYALELPGGAIRKCGIRNGDQVELVGVPNSDQAESAE
jgi:uncharacterized membrane protein (UPF0127 family)